MISVKEAKSIIQNHIKALPAETFSLINAAGLILAEDIYSTHNFPPFPQSSMDGYAFRFEDWKGEPLNIAGEMQAGAPKEVTVSKNDAVRIFTGAPLPTGLDTVVMQEKTLVNENRLKILDEVLVKGSNVRPPGSEMEQGHLALEKGTLLTAGAVGFLAGLGIKEVRAIRKPSVAIIVTGKELQQVGEPLSYGQVYESNSFALRAALQQVGVLNVSVRVVDDDLETLYGAMNKALSITDLLLITGGVSVGDYDFVAKALEQAGVDKLFHKIKQRPGKPLLFGKKGETVIFGLPGNPSSVLTCFYEYVLLAIQGMMDTRKPFIKAVQLPIAQDYVKKTNLTHFLKGRLANTQVVVLDAQGSYKMKSFALADCLVVLEEEKTEFKKGEMVEVHILP